MSTNRNFLHAVTIALWLLCSTTAISFGDTREAYFLAELDPAAKVEEASRKLEHSSLENCKQLLAFRNRNELILHVACSGRQRRQSGGA